MPKGINLKERHRYSGKDCELYFVSRVEPSSISMEISFISAMHVGSVEVKRYEECTH